MSTSPRKKKIVVLTGAGISQESGIKTFRDSGGLWENYPVEEVATPEGFSRNPGLVLDFYNARRRELKKARPNAAHSALKDLEAGFEAAIITQNVDDLHERAGSSFVLHLHGELMKARSINDETEILDWPGDLTLADRDARGHPLRPHVVWFGEAVPNMVPAVKLVAEADILLIIGTSLQVYPAAALYQYARPGIPIYLIDPHPAHIAGVTAISKKATAGVPPLVIKLLESERVNTTIA